MWKIEESLAPLEAAEAKALAAKLRNYAKDFESIDIAAIGFNESHNRLRTIRNDCGAIVWKASNSGLMKEVRGLKKLIDKISRESGRYGHLDMELNIWLFNKVFGYEQIFVDAIHPGSRVEIDPKINGDLQPGLLATCANYAFDPVPLEDAELIDLNNPYSLESAIARLWLRVRRYFSIGCELVATLLERSKPVTDLRSEDTPTRRKRPYSPKRKGPAETKLEGAFLLHHEFKDDCIGNGVPISGNALAKLAGVATSTACGFINKHFGSAEAYKNAAYDPRGRLIIVLRQLYNVPVLRERQLRSKLESSGLSGDD